MNSKKKIIIIFSVIFLLGLFLRGYDLTTESIWFDEGFTIKAVNQEDISGVIDQTKITETKPPMFFIFMYFWTQLVGISVLSIRIISMIAGSVSIFLMFILTKKLFDKKVALISTFLFSISLFEILYSQEGRVFSLFSTFTLLSFIYFTNFVKTENKGLVELTITNILLNSIHYIGLFVVLIQNIILFSLRKKTTITKKWFISQTVIAAAFVPFLPKFIDKILWFHFKLIEIFTNRWNLPTIPFGSGIFLFIIPFVIGILITYFGVKNWSKISEWYKKTNENIFLLLILLGYMFVLIFVQKLYSPFFITRYALFALPLIYLFSAKVLTDIKHKTKIITLIIIGIITIATLVPYYTDTTKEEWQNVVTFVEENEKLNEIIFFDAETANVPFEFYYSGKNTFVGLNEENMKILNQPDNFWIILSHNRNSIENINTLITKNLYVNVYQFKEIEVYHFTKREEE